MKFGNILHSGLALALTIAAVNSATAMAATAKTKTRKSSDRISTGYANAMGSSESGFAGRSIFSGVVVRPIFSFQTVSAGDLNKMSKKLVDGNTGIEVGSGVGWGLAADYPLIGNHVFVGVRLEHFNASSGTVAISKNPDVHGSANSSISGTPLMLTGTYLYPIASKMNIGGTLGAGLCLGYSTALEVEGSTFDALPNGTLTYGATPFVGQLTALTTYDFTRNIGLRLEAGYRLLSSDQMKATDRYADKVKEGEVLADENNANINVNGSGFYSGLSLSIRL